MLSEAPQSSLLMAYEYPHYIKYMGSKSKIMDFVINGINQVYAGGTILDLFAGSASLAGALRSQVPVHSNDIQEYSAVLAQAYLTAYKGKNVPTADELVQKAERIAKKHLHLITDDFQYKDIESLQHFNDVEESNRKLIELDFNHDYHLFTKNYAGTWWTALQCIWIDAFREVADEYKGKPVYPVILTSLMYAMAYTSQGTGHYAQYRDAKNIKSMKDIMIYRRRDLTHYFVRKYNDALIDIPATKTNQKHITTSLDFVDCLKSFVGGTVYADPPYCFVHYSRFYHAIETLVKYDYPELQIKGGKLVKGRYREGRHQSPFCIRTKVSKAFRDMFEGVKSTKSNLVLSYSKNGMIDMDTVEALAVEVFGKDYTLDMVSTDYKHMTLGRQGDRHRDVEECLVLAKHK
ncbi:DNA adenine methylase [Endozoicomonas euniceicola]|uniref:DNA adenine methylase n=1 Tax=Endozoicomonas euniceicola TaxID=1234143 RepID=A0ABY6H1Q2_9GAMM|nr:DNA adenine methylase [Endozoicomonas euniceicola]UYM18079.1 DNA adenine methylase [Endozoicomonas euniceicola]